jgi:hypothetical protein
VVHRDVKPHNILLPDRSGHPLETAVPTIAKLTDFGGAHIAGEEALTRTGDVLGTLAYMAPEQSEGREAGAQADLYSLALVLYEGLSGVNPVRGPTPAATVRRIGRPLAPLGRERRDLPRQLTHAIDAALAPEARDRGTLAELRDALGEALEVGARHARDPASRRGGQPVEPFAREPQAAPTRLLEQEGPAPVLAEDATDATGWLTVERFAWLAGLLALCAWQLGAGRSGVALLALCAVLPLVALVRRPGPSWLAAAFAPLLGVAGLAGAFPALAGQAASWRARALLGALGYWWLRLAEPLLDGPGHSLWLGYPPGTGGGSARSLWEGSPATAATHALTPLFTLGLLFGALVWALAAASLPLLVRGRSAMRDALAATAWAVALAAATPLLLTGLGGRAASAGAPRGVIVGSALGAVLAIAACAVRERADGRTGGQVRGRVG